MPLVLGHLVVSIETSHSMEISAVKNRKWRHRIATVVLSVASLWGLQASTAVTEIISKGEKTEIMIRLLGKWYETEFPMQLDQNFF